MNEEIITNGIDVSECAYYNKDNKPYCCEIWENECEAQNCYFKQLKRLQQENEELKKQLEFSRTHKTVLDAERIKYKQALEDIKEISNNMALTINKRKEMIANKINEVLNVEY